MKNVMICIASLIMLFPACSKDNSSDSEKSSTIFSYVTNYDDATISMYSMDTETGKLTGITGSPFNTYGNPVSIAIFPDGKKLYLNTNSGIAGYSIDESTGKLEQIAGTPINIGGNFLQISPSGKFIYFEQSGFSIIRYSIDTTTGIPVADDPEYSVGPGAETSVFAINSAGTLMYVSQTTGWICGYCIDAETGALNNVTPHYTTGTTIDMSSIMSLSITPNGKYIYVTNHESDNITGFIITQDTGELTAIAGSPFTTGDMPYSVTIDTTGSYLYTANFGSNTVSVYAIQSGSGSLKEISGSPYKTGTNPGTVSVDPSGKFLFILNSGIDKTNYPTRIGSNDISVFKIDSETGALTEVEGSPFAAGKSPAAIVFAKFEQK